MRPAQSHDDILPRFSPSRKPGGRQAKHLKQSDQSCGPCQIAVEWRGFASTSVPETTHRPGK
jgi:hypothetical protein